MIEIEYYIDAKGRKPFWEWQKSLKDLKGRVAVLTRLNRVQLGNLGDWKPLSKGLCELRVQYGPGYRIYFGREDEKKTIILCGGNKSTQKQNIKRAQEYWADWRGEI